MKKWIFFSLVFLIIIGIGVVVINSSRQEKPQYKDISLKQFNQNIQSNSNFILYVHETSCPACQETNPILNKLIKKNKLDILSLNIEKKENYDTNFLDKYKMSKVPAVIIYKNGKETKRIVGFHTESDYKTFFKIDKGN